MYKAALILILLSCQVSTSASAERAKFPEMIYGYPDVSVWTTRRNEDGQLNNPLLKLAQVLFDEAGIEWQAKAYPARRLFSYLKDGVVPFSMLVRAPSLEQCCLFSKKPVTGTELRFYRRTQSAAVKSRQDLNGKRVITIRGYSYGSLGGYLRAQENRVEIIEAASHEAAFKLLERDRGEYVIDYQGPAQEVISDHSIEVITSDFYQQLDVFMVLSRDYPDAVEVLNKLEASVAEMDVSAVLHSR